MNQSDNRFYREKSQQAETSPPKPTDPRGVSDQDLKAECLRRFTAADLLRLAVNKIGTLANRDRHWLLTQVAKEYQDGARELGDFEQRRKSSATQKG